MDDAAGVGFLALRDVVIRAVLVPTPRAAFLEAPPPPGDTEAEPYADGHPHGHPSRRVSRLVVLDATRPAAAAAEDPTSAGGGRSGGGDGGGGNGGGGRGLPSNDDG